MKRLMILIAFFPVFLSAQNLYLSGRLGMTTYQGDLKAKSYSLSPARLFGSVGARYDLSEHFTSRFYLSLGALHADDKTGTAFMKTRNLNFYTRLQELEFSLQYNLFSLNTKWWTPYLFAGVGIFHFNPYTYDTAGNKYFLQPLSTEGEGILPGVKNYHRTQLNIPLGIGAERALGENVRLGIEGGYRKLFTDYLDDVSSRYVDETVLLNAKGPKAVELAYRGGEVGAGPYPPARTTRGSEQYKDGYLYITLTLSVRISLNKNKEMTGLPSVKRGKKVGCPASRVN